MLQIGWNSTPVENEGIMRSEDKLSEPWAFFSKPATAYTESEAADYNWGRPLWAKNNTWRRVCVKFQNGMVIGEDGKAESSYFPKVSLIPNSLWKGQAWSYF